jgi:hypothetical protein
MPLPELKQPTLVDRSDNVRARDGEIHLKTPP